MTKQTLQTKERVEKGSRAIEPRTFAEKVAFLRKANRDYLDGRISWSALWYYEQRYGFGRNGVHETASAAETRA